MAADGSGAIKLTGRWRLDWFEIGKWHKPALVEDTGVPESPLLLKFRPNGWQFGGNTRLDESGVPLSGELLAWDPAPGTQSGPPPNSTTLVTMHLTYKVPWATINYVFCARRDLSHGTPADSFTGHYVGGGSPRSITLTRIGD